MPLNGQAAVFEAYDTVSNVRVVVKEITVPFAAAHNAAQQEQVQLAFTNQAQPSRVYGTMPCCT